MSDLSVAAGLDHIGIVGPGLDRLSQALQDLGFHLTPRAAHASGRTENRCAMLRDGGYLELITTVPGQRSATIDRFLAMGAGAHILALEIADDTSAIARLQRAGVTAEVSVTERNAGGAKARFTVILPPDSTAGRTLLIRHHTRDLLWRPKHFGHSNGAVALSEVVYASATPAAIMTGLSRISGRPAEPDPLGGYRIPLSRGCIRILPSQAAVALFPGSAPGGAPLLGLTITSERPEARVVHAGGVAIRFAAASR